MKMRWFNIGMIIGASGGFALGAGFAALMFAEW